MTMDRKFLLEWLSKEDSSSYGECKCKLLDELMAEGLVELATELPEPRKEFSRVRLTEKGWGEVCGHPIEGAPLYPGVTPDEARQ